LVSFKGGAFRSQIPEDAVAEARYLTAEQIERIRHTLTQLSIAFETTRVGDSVFISTKGKAAHSSKPHEGINAIAPLATALATIDWQPSAAASAVYYLNDLVGTGIYGERFGNLAYQHEFMGRMTLVPTQVTTTAQGDLSVFVNIRRPLGKSANDLSQAIEQTLRQWQAQRKINIDQKEIYIGEPLWVKDAPHVPILLNVFEHFTHLQNPQPIAIGGSTNAKLFPNAVSFGPSMPGTEYTGHSEHEFITQEQFILTIKMYTAAIVEIAGTAQQ
jgi:dipeptidase D